jgi:hypothetical protein
VVSQLSQRDVSHWPPQVSALSALLHFPPSYPTARHAQPSLLRWAWEQPGTNRQSLACSRLELPPHRHEQRLFLSRE